MRGGLAGEENRGGLQLEKEILPPGIFIHTYCIMKEFLVYTKKTSFELEDFQKMYRLTSLKIYTCYF